VGAVLLRAVAGDRLGVSPELVRVTRTCRTCGRPHGKPQIDGVEISVAHSGDYTAVAISSDRPVGVDIEAVDDFDYTSLIPFVCASEERASLVSTEAFYTCWTRKESLLKAAGTGLAIPMSSLRVTPFDEEPRLLSSPIGFPSVAAMADVSPAAGYRGALSALAGATIAVRTHDVTSWMGSGARLAHLGS